MKRITSLLCAAAFFACGGGDDTSVQEMEDSAAAAMAPAPTATLNLSDLAGSWNVRVLNENGDSTLATYTLQATGEPSGWTMTFPDGQPIPLRVTVDADSIIYDAGPYESPIRKGVQTTTQGAGRLVDGRLIGTFTAHYAVSAPDSVLRGRLEGTRNP
jgi:hypothetical protein